ncbi:hypothetical protein B5M47_03365 [candidate division CPR3 bacterium 4484_211]|uniref:O-antigen ligase-related domain-containing protein n=1 Tax=candidate division CPR3 bacterium 4484_211 TaxID=1968527 RepID=A0A1W9NX47_UNCC3|nr:MAG: hypothetical protein B5M47_03365 [candidate division CPR3 bacterium 4484_211]
MIVQLFSAISCSLFVLGNLLFTLFLLTLFLQTRYPLCCTYQYIDYGIPFVYLSDIALLLFLLAVAVNPSRRESFWRWLSGRRELYLAAFLFCLAAGISNIGALSKVAAWYRWFKIIELFLVSALAGWWISDDQKRKMRVWLIMGWGLLAPCLIAIGEFILGRSLGFQFLGEWRFNVRTPGISTFFWRGKTWLRPYSTFPHPNVLGGILSLIIPAIYLFRKQLLAGWAVRFLVVILAATLVLTFSRTAWISCFTLTFLGYVYLKHKPQNWPKYLLIFLLVSLLVFFLPSPVRERLLSVLSTDSLSLVRRWELAKFAFGLIKKRPLFGVGCNQFPFWMEKYGRISGTGPNWQPVHNLWLLITAENGLVGFLVFVGFFFRLVCSLLRRAGTEQVYLLIILFGFLMTSFWDHYWWTSQEGMMFLGVVLGFSLVFARSYG